MSRMRVGIFFGGRSTEHEVSVTSAATVLDALDPERFEAVLIGVDPEGRWRLAESDSGLGPRDVVREGPALPVEPVAAGGLRLVPVGAGGAGGAVGAGGPVGQGGPVGAGGLRAPLDVAFPIIHGRGGEDGSLQGLFELADLPYAGSGVAATALCMDKTLSKGVLSACGIPVVPSLETARAELLVDSEEFAHSIERRFDFPVFLKPVNTGSSVGVSRANSPLQLRQSIKEAARYDLTVMAEPGIDAREVECGVIGGHEPQVSVLGEVSYDAEFYDYEAKYRSDQTQLHIPADLPADVAERMRKVAIDAFCKLKCWGMARVDFFVDRSSGEFYLNELNTLPGFTSGSMFPRAWEASGLSHGALVERLIELALERAGEQRSLEVRFKG